MDQVDQVENKSESQRKFWFVALAIFVLVVWALKPMLLPFVLAAAIAYFLNPVVNFLSRSGFVRWFGTSLVLLGFALCVVLVLVLVVPLLESQIAALLKALPSYLESLRNYFQPLIVRWIDALPPDTSDKLQAAAGDFAGSILSWAGGLLKSIVTSGFAIFDVVTFLLITPVVAFYLLRDWPKLTRSIDKLLPRQHYDMIKTEVNEIDRTLSGFVRGQALVCLGLGSFYAIGLTLAGLQYGASIGIVAGILSFIPYVGSTFGLVTSIALGLAQFDELWRVGVVLGVFVCGQILEGYVLTPKLVGDRVGLHPVWILFALFAGGSLMGFLGVLIAVPVAAIIGVLVRFALRHYKSSRFYDVSSEEVVSCSIKEDGESCSIKGK